MKKQWNKGMLKRRYNLIVEQAKEKDNFTDEDIKKALEQADANIAFEEVTLLVLEQEKVKVLRIDKNDKPRGR